MTTETSALSHSRPGRAWGISLWIAQGLIFVSFVLFGCMKLFMPTEKLAAMWGWPGAVPGAFLALMGIIDIAGGVGIFLPALTGIKPRLSVLAAMGCVALQISAIIFHASRGEFQGLPLNFILLALCSFILWGRTKKVPFAA